MLKRVAQKDQRAAREGCSEGLLRRVARGVRCVHNRCSITACAGLNGSHMPHTRVPGWGLKVQVNAAVCWRAALVGCVGACRSSRGAERVRILHFLCLSTGEHASRGNAGSFGQVWCAGATRPGLGHMCNVLQGRAFGLRARSSCGISRPAVRTVCLRRAGELAASRADALGASVCAAGRACVCVSRAGFFSL